MNRGNRFLENDTAHTLLRRKSGIYLKQSSCAAPFFLNMSVHKRKLQRNECITKRRKTEEPHPLLQYIKSGDAIAAFASIRSDTKLSPYSADLLREVVKTYFVEARASIDWLPLEIIENILSYLDPVELIKMQAVSTKFRNASKNICGRVKTLRIRRSIIELPLFQFYPSCNSLTLNMAANSIFDESFLLSLASSRVKNIIFYVKPVNFKSRTRENPLQDIVFCNIRTLHFLGSGTTCPCHFFRGNATLKKNFPSLAAITFRQKNPQYHVSRCRILTLIKQSLPHLQHLHLGPGLYSNYQDLSSSISRIVLSRHNFINYGLSHIRLSGFTSDTFIIRCLLKYATHMINFDVGCYSPQDIDSNVLIQLSKLEHLKSLTLRFFIETEMMTHTLLFYELLSDMHAKLGTKVTKTVQFIANSYVMNRVGVYHKKEIISMAGRLGIKFVCTTKNF